MERMMSTARVFKQQVADGKIKTLADYDKIREWSREMRHRVVDSQWSGEKWAKVETAEDVLNPVHVEVVEHLQALDGSLVRLEEKYVHEMLQEISERKGIPMPKYRFIDGCNPLKPQAWMKSKDLKFSTLGGEQIIVRPEEDELIFCRGQTSPYAVAHEACHHLERVDSGQTTEAGATECALSIIGHRDYSVKNVETLNTLTVKKNTGAMMDIVDNIKPQIPLLAGVLVGELVDESGAIDQTVIPLAGQYSGLVKAAIGLG
ncbi:unnamed protein product, partial [marine sediment metagenome]